MIKVVLELFMNQCKNSFTLAMMFYEFKCYEYLCYEKVHLLTCSFLFKYFVYLTEHYFIKNLVLD